MSPVHDLQNIETSVKKFKTPDIVTSGVREEVDTRLTHGLVR